MRRGVPVRAAPDRVRRDGIRSAALRYVVEIRAYDEAEIAKLAAIGRTPGPQVAGYGQTVDQYEGEIVFALMPDVVFAWTELANAAR